MASPIARKVQWCNQWPEMVGEQLGGGWPTGWADCGRALGSPGWGTVGALEVSQDRARFGVAVAELDQGGVVRVWSAGATSADEVRALLFRWSPSVLLVGVTIADEFADDRWLLEKVGRKETAVASPVLVDLVARGRLLHDHDPRTLLEVAGAKVLDTEAGPVLSARRSSVPIPAIKAATWAAWAAYDGRFTVVEPQIW